MASVASGTTSVDMGGRANPGSGYEFDTLSEDLAMVVEQLNLRGVTLVVTRPVAA